MATRPRLVASLVVAGLLAAGCTGNGNKTPTTKPPKSSGSGSPTPPITVGNIPGDYKYVNAGLTATVHLTGSTGTLQIVNKTGRDLGKPALYILDARDGSHVNVKVDGSAPIRNGQTESFDVTVQATLELKNIGWLDLVIGGDDYGGFVQQ